MFLSILRVAAFTAVILQASALAAPKRKAPAIQTRPPFLKINDYTVLYLNPVSPYQDAHGTLMVPVKRLAALLGVDAKSAPDGKTVTLTGNGHTVVFTAGGIAQADGQAMSLPSKPSGWPGTEEIVAPVEEIASGLGIRCEWAPEHRVFQMHFDNALSFQEDNLHSVPAVSIIPDPGISTMSFQMSLRTKPSGFDTVKHPELKGFETQYLYRLGIVLHNGSARPIVDDSVVDVIDQEPPGTGADSFSGPMVRLSFGDSPVPNEATIRPGQVYYYTQVANGFHPIVAVIIAGGSLTPAAYRHLKKTHT